MSLGSVLLVNLGAVMVLVVLLWLVSVALRDVSIVDIFWGLGFAVIGWVTFAVSANRSVPALVLTLVVSIWALRLAGYLAWRNWGKPEDYRYAAMRERHGARFPLVSLVTVFGLQAALMWIISWPVQTGIAKSTTWGLVASLGLAMWAVGFLFESIGDFQLARFKADPANRGRVMDRGLWRYTRHPNYFGDFLVWWGFYLLSLEQTSWWWTIVGPVLMSILLIRVSGVRLLESSLRRRVDGYDSYVRRTSSFFPLPPRPESSVDGSLSKP